jgi:hypothetical protein
MILLKMRCGAAVLGLDFKNLVLPQNGIPHIAADNDDTGIPAAQCAQRIWRARGLDVRISHPATVGWDFNNELLGR